MSRPPGLPKSGTRWPYGGVWMTVREIAEDLRMPVTTLRSRIWVHYRDEADKERAVNMAISKSYTPRIPVNSFETSLALRLDRMWRATGG